MMIVQFFWFIQSQSDAFIAGRILGPGELGLYTTAVFLAQILAAKFVPPLNEIAFATYSRMQGDQIALASDVVEELLALVRKPAVRTRATHAAL